MKRKNELGYRDLKITCDPKLLNFNTTDDLETSESDTSSETDATSDLQEAN